MRARAKSRDLRGEELGPGAGRRRLALAHPRRRRILRKVDSIQGAALRVDDESRPWAKARAHEQDRDLKLDFLLVRQDGQHDQRSSKYFSSVLAGRRLELAAARRC